MGSVVAGDFGELRGGTGETGRVEGSLRGMKVNSSLMEVKSMANLNSSRIRLVSPYLSQSKVTF